MNYKVDIEPLSEKDLDAIAELTYQTKDYAEFVSLLGLSYLKKIYFKNIIEFAFGFVAKVNGEFAGYIINTDNLKSYFDYITSKRKLQSIPFMIGLVLKHPKSFWNLVKVKLYLKEYENLDVNAEITLFAVAEKYRNPEFLKASGINISKILMEKTLQDFNEKGVNKIKLEVPAINILAQVFYRSYGFEKVSSIEFNEVKRNIYLKRL